MAKVTEKKKKKKQELKESPVIMDSEFEESADDSSDAFTLTKPNWDYVLSTGSTLLDLAISGGRIPNGGIPTGILAEVSGESQCGKTSLMVEILSRAQRRGGGTRIADPESRLDKEYAAITGLSIQNEHDYEIPDTVEEFFKYYADWDVDPDVPNVFGGDSLAALSTKMEMEAEDKMGMKRAKDFSAGFRKLCRTFRTKNVLMLCTNQIRDSQTGKTIPGGNAVPFYSSVRVSLSPAFPSNKIIKKKTIRGVIQEKTIGRHIVAHVIKNSLDDPYRKVPLFFVFNYGIDDIRGNLFWTKQCLGNKVYTLPGGLEVKSIDKAISVVEEQCLEKKLRKETRALWREIEKSFRTERKPKEY